MRKSLHGFDGHGFIERQRVQTRHAHQFRHAVDFGGTGTAFARLTIPADGQIAGLFRLDLMNGIENHHAGGDLGFVVLELSLASLAAPDAECCRLHYFISSITCFNSSRMGDIGSRVNSSSPRSPLRATMLNLPDWSSFLGKSSRKWAPRLSFRSSAARAIISATVSRLSRSRAVCQPLLYSRLPSTPTRSLRTFSSRMRSSACNISCSCRTMPTRSCITSCKVCCTT